eukprot:7955632-Lingulodinium_polyedra.AAC.1
MCTMTPLGISVSSMRVGSPCSIERSRRPSSVTASPRRQSTRSTTPRTASSGPPARWRPRPTAARGRDGFGAPGCAGRARPAWSSSPGST